MEFQRIDLTLFSVVWPHTRFERPIAYSNTLLSRRSPNDNPIDACGVSASSGQHDGLTLVSKQPCLVDVGGEISKSHSYLGQRFWACLHGASTWGQLVSRAKSSLALHVIRALKGASTWGSILAVLLNASTGRESILVVGNRAENAVP